MVYEVAAVAALVKPGLPVDMKADGITHGAVVMKPDGYCLSHISPFRGLMMVLLRRIVNRTKVLGLTDALHHKLGGISIDV